MAVLITSHNRREKTLAAIQAVKMQTLGERAKAIVYLVDAGSTDGTVDEVRRTYPETVIVEATSDIFWNRGTSLAWKTALVVGHDFYFWLNDDTLLEQDTFRRFLKTDSALRAKGHAPGIIVGSTADPESGATTYGGQVQCSRFNPLKLRIVEPCAQPQKVDTMNGNCVMVSKGAAQVVGNVDWNFIHAMGDTDYGLRAKKLGVEIWTAPGVVGYCARNAIEGSWRDDSLPFRQRWRKLLGPKGLPVHNWFVITRRHGGVIWPILWAWPYCKLVVESALIWGRSKAGGVRNAQ